MPSSHSKYSLTVKIFIGMLAGILVGFLLKTFIFVHKGEYSLTLLGSSISAYDILVDGIFTIIGQIFIASLKMLVVPLVFVSLVCGTCRLSDPSKLGRLGGKTLGLYIGTTAIAVSMAIGFALLIGPGTGIDLPTSTSFHTNQPPGLAQVIINMFPTNPIDAMAKGNMLQIIVFAVLFGIAMALSGDAGKRLSGMFDDLNDVIMRLVILLMKLAPYGVFALMAKLFATMAFDTFGSLIIYFLTVVGVLLIHGLIVYPSLFILLTRLNPILFLRKMRDTCIFAFSTSSSNATLPVTLETVTQKMGVKNSVASFTIPLGATINMDGTAIMQGVATVFIAQAYGVDLSVGDYLMVVLTATLASVGTAGVPGVGLITLAMVLQQVNLPVEGIGIIIGVDRLLDMTRTMVNVTGDSMVTCIVGKSEGKMDLNVFNDPEAGSKLEESETTPA